MTIKFRGKFKSKFRSKSNSKFAGYGASERFLTSFECRRAAALFTYRRAAAGRALSAKTNSFGITIKFKRKFKRKFKDKLKRIGRGSPSTSLRINSKQRPYIAQTQNARIRRFAFPGLSMRCSIASSEEDSAMRRNLNLSSLMMLSLFSGIEVNGAASVSWTARTQGGGVFELGNFLKFVKIWGRIITRRHPRIRRAWTGMTT
jgi:hypothetical protein